MGIVISYDVSDKNTEMKAELLAKDYLDCWESDKITYNLPNTTLWHPDKTAAQGLQDMKDAAVRLRIKLERAVAVPTTPWAAIPGEPHKKN